jgi:hypothetical protein
MSVPTQDAWEIAQAQTPPSPSATPPMDAWDVAATQLGKASTSVASLPKSTNQTTPGGFPEPQQSDNYPAGAEVPFEQRLATNMVQAGQGMMAGNLGGKIAAGVGGKVLSFFEAPESLKSAGITAQTLRNMAPGGQNPADYTAAVENQLSGYGVLDTTPKGTWNAMNTDLGKGVTAVKNALNTVREEASANAPQSVTGIVDPLMIDAKTAIQPLLEKVQQAAQGAYGATKEAAKPFQDAANWLVKQAQLQGGKISFDNVDALMKETGSMMDQGPEAEAIYGPVYGGIADMKDGMVKTVADLSGDPNVRQQLLENNAKVSTYLRLMPSIEKATYQAAVKEGVSAYQKYIGPLGTKFAMAGGAYAGIRKVLDMALGTGH